jgi:hypothetical protein
MTNPTEQDLIRWRDAGVLVEASYNGSQWRGPFDGYIKVKDSDETFYANGHYFKQLRPYRAPGHIQPYDGSAERPEWVPEMALVLAGNKMLGWCYAPSIAMDINWQRTHYFIVLPEVKP